MKKFLTDSEQGTGSETEVTKRVGLLTREDKENVFFETRDRDAKGAWIHRGLASKV